MHLRGPGHNAPSRETTTQCRESTARCCLPAKARASSLRNHFGHLSFAGGRGVVTIPMGTLVPNGWVTQPDHLRGAHPPPLGGGVRPRRRLGAVLHAGGAGLGHRLRRPVRPFGPGRHPERRPPLPPFLRFIPGPPGINSPSGGADTGEEGDRLRGRPPGPGHG